MKISVKQPHEKWNANFWEAKKKGIIPKTLTWNWWRWNLTFCILFLNPPKEWHYLLLNSFYINSKCCMRVSGIIYDHFLTDWGLLLCGTLLSQGLSVYYDETWWWWAVYILCTRQSTDSTDSIDSLQTEYRQYRQFTNSVQTVYRQCADSIDSLQTAYRRYRQSTDSIDSWQTVYR